MHSPTALTPEPAGDISSSMDSHYSTSIEASLGQVSISLTPSPLAVRSFEDNSLNSGASVNKSIQEIALDNNTSSNTPNKPTVLNQTPLRSTSSFLTPPSSDERPAAPAISFVSTQPAPVFSTEKKVPLAEKIKARSVLYSQAIQKQQQQHTTSPEQHPAPKQTSDPSRDGAAVNHFTSHRSAPQLTYHQLQQQQQFINRQNINSSQDEKKQEGVAAGEKLASAKSSLTATDIPAGVLPRDADTKSNAPRKVSDGSIVTPSITKTDPLDNPLNTTNVYVNGLPLRWTDDDLYRLTRGFGAVKSVKMFTRHLEDKPSAYGFVLFNCIEDAERFITTLRQHTQFHPSFAKTMKVPGTTNAKHAIADPVIPPPRDEEYADISITGLPLTIDMQTLATLFAPQAIKASKFFHTAGTPRRLVGFIRLESRQAAEDIVERLHGSNILGWSENLEVHHSDSNKFHAANVPNAYGPGMMNPSQTNGLLPSTHQPIFDVASTPNFSTLPPSIGVYQHQDLQLADLSRLLETMRLSLDAQNKPTGDSAVLPQNQGQYNVSKSSESPSPVKQTQTPLTPSLFDLAQLQTLASMAAANRQTQVSSTGHNAGLGINLGPFSVNSSEPALGALAFHQYHQAQGPDSGQAAHFQTTYGTSTEALQVLQAAVNIQDRALSSAGTDSSATSPVVGFNPDERVIRGSSFPSLKEVMPGSAIDNNHLLGRMRGFSQTSENAPSPMSMTSPISGKGFRSAMRIPPPILPGAAISNVTASFLGMGIGNGGNVPHLLPALSPSSPHASSEESSPITPTFHQLPRHLLGEHDKDI